MQGTQKASFDSHKCPCIYLFDCCFNQLFLSTTPLAKLTRNPEESLFDHCLPSCDLVESLCFFCYLDVSICHTISTMTSPSICQLHDSSVCQPKCDSTWNSVHPSVCLSSVPSAHPSANFMMKKATSIAV